MRIARRRGTIAAVLLAASATLLAGCAGSAAGARPSRVADQGPLSTQVGGRAGRSAPLPVTSHAPVPAALPGVGPRTLAEIPAGARQAVLVTGDGRDSANSKVTFYRYDDTAGWVPAAATWQAHNALRGWTDDHHTGDLRSPIGVFTLTDAGGRLTDPGTKLSYDHAPIGFTVGGTGFHGESLRGAFDYVIAINYNREPGTSPRDWTRPLGDSRGGGIWLHVDHGGPTQGCVSLPPTAMKTLLRTLNPAQHPVVVMGDAADLAR
ncbi:L,D-transpeptidase family protein [Streptomyces polygonati]|uniref:L,D-transpeptidase family protein n=1 Tax=Streptomyces polygonati TaxID=1617087 RepID=A0ABV8HWM5_9ACTN